MERKFLTLLFSCIIISANLGYSQVGINTNTPQSSLQIKESDPQLPKGNDGLLLPVIHNFPTIGPPTEGNIVRLQKVSGISTTNEPDGFYYWKDGEWIRIVTYTEAVYEYPNVYCVYGTGYDSSVAVDQPRQIQFSDLVYNPTKERQGVIFTLDDNELVVGKQGIYMVSLVTGSKKEGESSPSQQANMKGEVLVNGQPYTSEETILPISAMGSTSVEGTTGAQLVVNGVIKLNVGDRVSARIIQQDVAAGTTGNAIPVANQAPYNNLGLSTLTLTFLYNL